MGHPQLRLEGCSLIIWLVLIEHLLCQALDAAVSEAEKVSALRECFHVIRGHRQAVIQTINQAVSESAKE